MVYAVYGLAIAVIILAILLVWALRRLRTKTKKTPENTRDASELLAYLLSGGAVVVTQIINPDDILLHSPRDRT